MLSKRMNVVLCWHMHQPVYRLRGEDSAPWTYLHGIKDYADMAAHLERVPGARAVVNFSPVLLEHLAQLTQELALAVQALDREDIAGACAALHEPTLIALLRTPADAAARRALYLRCLQVHPRTMLGRYPVFAQLAALVTPVLKAPELERYLAPDCLDDLLVWFHVAWFGEATRRSSPLLQQLQSCNDGFCSGDRQALFRLIADELAGLLPRYRALAASGQVELAVSPWGHPILPLLIDMAAGQETQPASALPAGGAYPGGRARALWHVEQSKLTFKAHFGHAPTGCWPSEGAISGATLELLAQCGFRWAASGGAVLRNASRVDACTGADAAADADACEHGGYALASSGMEGPEQALQIFFRDDGLSDAIGFKYQSWRADTAVEDLIAHLLSIHALCPSPDAVVPIILDGENAWEYYPENAYDFLQLLYTRLSTHPQLRLVTFAEQLEQAPQPAFRLQSIRAGSWVHGDLSTWVGNTARNRAWDLLIAAKHAFDSASLDATARIACTQLLAACECSDWFWWLSEHQNADALARFETLYRGHLQALYAGLGVQPPAELFVPIAVGDATAQASVMLSAE